MTLKELDRLKEDVALQKAASHSSKAMLHINKLEKLIAIAKRGASMSELEQAAANRKRRAA
jgi:hypothetical protein